MILTQLEPYQGFFCNGDVKQEIYNDAHDTINAADPDLQPKMSALFDEFRRINREFAKLVAEQDCRDSAKPLVLDCGTF